MRRGERVRIADIRPVGSRNPVLDASRLKDNPAAWGSAV